MRSKPGAAAEAPDSSRLREHLGAVVALMKVSAGYPQFEKFLDIALPRWHETA